MIPPQQLFHCGKYSAVLKYKYMEILGLYNRTEENRYDIKEIKYFQFQDV